ncbi:hypothetical protein GQ43DRAFT_236476 [Delitschia confertaspora ATCC 74209]|uniref:DUF1772-domain-containing protein n=1 Tax=Delitschia confertaspora ATCC 74209 TaxID=1513339 RepID=A0A9P4JV68_9PLEO|nr:hypothetical protein GQ43DRAFT_236476 [Delitschia confertaspora ATCC 74209]
MSNSIITQAITGTCITFSFILAGNAVTQSFMTIPALVVNFPTPGSTTHTERCRLLGAQWPLCWSVGNVFFRPLSMLGFVGYTYAAYSLFRDSHPSSTLANSLNSATGEPKGDWRILAVSAALHLVTVVHSAVNMQPLNDKLENLARAGEKDLVGAEAVAQRWGKWNLVRLVNPVVAGVLALSQLVKS